MRRYRNTAGEVFRFGVVGVTATLVHFLVLNGAVGAIGTVLANGFAFCCAVGVTYFGQSIWVFKQQPLNLYRLRRFMVSAIGGLGANMGLMAILAEGVGWHHNLVFALSLVVVPSFLFFLNKFWVFKGTPQ